MNVKAILYALASAALFGASTPAAKVLLGSLHPVALAGLLYCGAGVGAALLRRTTLVRRDALVGRTQVPYLGSAIIAGGVVGPILLMVDLARTEAATASLLLTLESVATALLAWYVFRESGHRAEARS
jgi:drug/metabolite transporter (DMT)-like permease